MNLNFQEKKKNENNTPELPKVKWSLAIIKKRLDPRFAEPARLDIGVADPAELLAKEIMKLPSDQIEKKLGEMNKLLSWLSDYHAGNPFGYWLFKIDMKETQCQVLMTNSDRLTELIEKKSDLCPMVFLSLLLDDIGEASLKNPDLVFNNLTKFFKQLEKIDTHFFLGKGGYWGLFNRPNIKTPFLNNPSLLLNAMEKVSSKTDLKGKNAVYVLQNPALLEDQDFIKKLEVERQFLLTQTGTHIHNFFLRFFNPSSANSECVQGEIKEFTKKLQVLQKTFNIEFFERFDLPFINHLYQMATTPQYENEKPLALLILNKHDWNDAFEANPALYSSLLGGYRIVVVEADKDAQAINELETIYKKYGKLNLLLMGGHGSQKQLQLGATTSEESDNIDVEDFKKFGGKGAFEKYLDKDAIVVLESCSTGAGGPIENEQDLGNIMSMMGILTQRKVLAPNVVTSIVRFIFDQNGKVTGVFWNDRGANEAYVPKN